MDENQSQNLVLVQSAQPKHPTKITAREENLLAIHRKILSHLRNEKPLTKFELRKLLAILKRIDCSSPRDQKVAQSAHDILVKCIHSQTSQRQDHNLTRYSSDTTSSSSTSSETETALDASNDLDKQQLLNDRSETKFDTNIRESTFTKNESVPYETKSKQQLAEASASNIFSSQTQNDEIVSCVKKMSLSNDNENRASDVNVLSRVFLRRQSGMSFDSDVDDDDRDNNRTNIDKDNVMCASFSVPTLLEKGDNFGDSQPSKVFKLRLQDVQFDSDTVSIPIELLTNLNFASGEGSSQGIASQCTQNPFEKTSHNKSLSINSIDNNTQNMDTLTVAPDLTEKNYAIHFNTASSKETFLDTNIKVLQEGHPQSQNTFTKPDFYWNKNHSSNADNIELVNSRHDHRYTTSGSGQKEDEIIYCVTTSESNSSSLVPIISFCTTNSKTPPLNTETERTNTKNPNWNESLVVKGNLFEPDDDNVSNSAKTKFHAGLSSIRYINCTPNKTTQANINDEIVKDAWSTPSIVKNLTPNSALIPFNSEQTKKTTSNDIETNVTSEKFNHVWYIPSKNTPGARSPTSNATVPNSNIELLENVLHMPSNNNAKNTNTDIVPVDNVMKVCQGWMDEQGNVGMTDAEKTYLEMVANGTGSETNDFIVCQNGTTNKVKHQSEVDETESFVFNLDIDYNTDDVIEATPFDNKLVFQNRNSNFSSKKLETQIATTNFEIISETPDIIIDETPYSKSETPVIQQNISSSSIEVVPRTQTTPVFNPYKNRPRLNCFQEMYKSNYQRRSLRSMSKSSKVNIIKNIRVNKKDAGQTQSQTLGDISTQEKNVANKTNKPTFFNMADSLSLRQFTKNSTTASPAKPSLSTSNVNAMNGSNPILNHGANQSENIVLIDGTVPKNAEEMDTSQVDPEIEETFEEKTRKIKEKIIQKRNKYRETWQDRPVTERVSLKYVRKFGVNIYEDPASSLLNIAYNVNVNNFHFPRLTMKEINERLMKSSEKAKLLNEALTKMIDNQISSSSEEDYLTKMAREASVNSDSDSSDEDEQKKKEKMLQEIEMMTRLEIKKFMEDMEKERKKELARLKQEKATRDVAEQNKMDEPTEQRGTSKLVKLLREADDFSWLK